MPAQMLGVAARAAAANREAARLARRALSRNALWGAAAAATLVLAVIISRSEAGAQRVGMAVASLTGRSVAPAKRQFDAEGETRRLGDALHGLADDRDRLMTRVEALEQNLDAVTGSVTRQLAAARNPLPAAPWPDEPAPVATPPATIAAIVAPALAAAPPAGLRPAVGDTAALVPSEPSVADETVLGVDLGSAQTIQGLRARWLAIRTAHQQLFVGVRPIVSVRDAPKANRAELRLVIGPLANAGAVEQMCATLVASHLPCQPAVFDGQRLALH